MQMTVEAFLRLLVLSLQWSACAGKNFHLSRHLSSIGGYKKRTSNDFVDVYSQSHHRNAGMIGVYICMLTVV